MVKLRINSSVVRSLDFSMRSRLIDKTGLGPTSDAVGMFDPVTITRSVSAVSFGVGVTSWPGLLIAEKPTTAQ